MSLKSTVLVVGVWILVTAMSCRGRSDECLNDSDCPEAAYCHESLKLCFGRGTDAGFQDSGAELDSGLPQDSGINDDAGVSEDAGAFTDAGTEIQQPACSGGGWCWFTPFPSGSWFTHVHGSSGNDVWASSSFGGELLRWNGQTWKQHPKPFDGDYSVIWAFAPDDAWAVGQLGRISHWTGQAWNPVPSGTASDLYALVGLAPDSIWAAGADGVILHWNGVKWSAETSGTVAAITALHGRTSEALRAVGEGGLILRRDGTNGAWTSEPSNTTNRLLSICSTPDGTAWAAGIKGTFLLNRGTGWVSASNATVDIWSLACVDDNNVWAGISGGYLHWNGTELEVVQRGDTSRRYSLWFSSPTEAWAVGSHGLLERWNGSSWTRHSRSLLPPARVESIWAASADDVLVGLDADSRVVRCGELGCLPAYSVDGGPRVSAVTGTSSKNIWFATGTEIIHWDGYGWRPTITADTPISSLAARADSDGGSDLWYATGEALFRCPEGGPCAALDAGLVMGMNRLAAGDSEIWATLMAGGIIACKADGSSCARRDVPNAPPLQGIWVDPAGTAIVVGNGGFIASWGGTQWTLESAPAAASLNAVHGTSPTNVWTCGEDGALFRRGLESSWIRAEGLPGLSCNGLHIVSPSSAWISTPNGLARLSP